MKHRARGIVAVGIVAGATLFFAGCENGDSADSGVTASQLVGSWEAVSQWVKWPNGETSPRLSISDTDIKWARCTILANGRFTWEDSTQTFSGDWSLQGDVVTFASDSGEALSYLVEELSGNKVILSMSGTWGTTYWEYHRR